MLSIDKKALTTSWLKIDGSLIGIGEQYSNDRQKELMPERKLCAAMIQRSMLDLTVKFNPSSMFVFKKKVDTHRAKIQRDKIYREALKWINDRDIDSPFSFDNCCEYLEMPPEKIRNTILNLKEDDFISSLSKVSRSFKKK